MKVLGIIPARAGSKGIPGKNMVVIQGKPLIYYSISVAQKAQTLDHFFVSTDGSEIRDVCSEYTDQVWMRPENLARDESNISDVIRYHLEELKKQGQTPDIIVLIQPTSPLRRARDIDECVGRLQNSKANSIISVSSLEDHHPSRLYRLDSRGAMESLDPDHEQTPRQDLETLYQRNGCIYACKTEAFLKHRHIMASPQISYIMPSEDYLNIDTPRDLQLAEIMIPNFNFG